MKEYLLALYQGYKTRKILSSDHFKELRTKVDSGNLEDKVKFCKLLQIKMRSRLWFKGLEKTRDFAKMISSSLSPPLKNCSPVAGRGHESKEFSIEPEPVVLLKRPPSKRKMTSDENSKPMQSLLKYRNKRIRRKKR